MWGAISHVKGTHLLGAVSLSSLVTGLRQQSIMCSSPYSYPDSRGVRCFRIPLSVDISDSECQFQTAWRGLGNGKGWTLLPSCLEWGLQPQQLLQAWASGGGPTGASFTSMGGSHSMTCRLMTWQTCQGWLRHVCPARLLQ